MPSPAPAPDWARGACTTHPDPDLWTASHPALRKAATLVCSRCPVLAACREWSVVTLPVSDRSVWGGMLAADRIRARQQLRAQEAARLEREAARLAAQRRDGRNSERRRRMLGLAETPEQQRERYAANPEPQKAAARAYYQAHAEEVKAKRRARHARDRELVNAQRREQYAASRSTAA